jgi:integrase/recombinase XerD
MRNTIIDIPQTIKYKKESESFHKHLLTLGYSPHTALVRYRHLMRFLCQMEQEGITAFKEIQAQHLVAYYEQEKQKVNRKTGEKLNPGTIHYRLTILQKFFTKLQAEGRITINPAGSIKFPYPRQVKEPNREILTQTEVKELYNHTINYQEKAMLSLAYGCGLRVGELTACNIADIRLRERILVVPNGKGNKRRVVPMSSGVISDLSDYFFKERPRLSKGRDYKKNEPAFMLHSRGGRMMKYTYNKRLKALIVRTGNEKIEEKEITIHNLRHSIATHLIDQGIPVEQVREFLGHSQLETTQVYTHINRKHLKNLKR